METAGCHTTFDYHRTSIGPRSSLQCPCASQSYGPQANVLTTSLVTVEVPRPKEHWRADESSRLQAMRLPLMGLGMCGDRISYSLHLQVFDRMRHPVVILICASLAKRFRDLAPCHRLFETASAIGRYVRWVEPSPNCLHHHLM